MAYFYRNSGGALAVTAGTTGAGTAASMPNTGTSIIGATSGEAYVLQPPVAGCRKRIIFTAQTTGALPIVRSSTTSGGAPTFLIGATTGINTLTLTTARILTTPTIVDLEGIGSTSWVVTNIWPNTSVAIGSVTASSA